MILKFQKVKDKQSTLTCIRKDDSITWTKLYPGMEIHDLAHYAVETVLSFQEAFYGTVAKGFDIDDFEAPREKRPNALIPANLSLESIQTEHIVNLLQVNYANSSDDFDLIETLEGILTEKEIPFPKNLNQISLQKIKEKLEQLLSQWNQLREGEILALKFDLSN